MNGSWSIIETTCFVVLYSIGFISLIMQTYCIWVFVREKRAVYFLKRHYKTLYWSVGVTYLLTLRILFGYTYENYLTKCCSWLSQYGIVQLWSAIPTSIGSKMLTLRLWLCHTVYSHKICTTV